MTQTIEQLTARVRELTAEVERLSAAHVKACQANADSQAELAASQLHAEQLRVAIDRVRSGAAALGLDRIFDIATEALALPRDTSALDAYVAEKVKEIIESHAPEGRNVTNAQHVEMRHKFLEQIATLTRQRDLAVEALERLEHSFDFGEIAGIEPEACGRPKKFIANILSAIKESEQP